MSKRVQLPGLPRILHVHSSLDSDAYRRTVRLIRAFGNAARHAVVVAERGDPAEDERLTALANADFPPFPRLTGWPAPARLKSLAAAMQRYDLVCTYGWGAMDAAMAHTLFADVFQLSPLIHHEDGFDEDEARRLKRRRNIYRRIALGRTAALVVPSHDLERIALDVWQQPRSRVQRIAPGVPVAAFGKKPRRDTLPMLVKHKDEFWIGTHGPLKPSANIPALVRLTAALPEEWNGVAFGEGSARSAILAEAERLEVEHRVHLPGPAEPERTLGLLDIFAVTSDSGQAPVSVLQAMAAGLPIVAPARGDIADFVAEENAPFIVPAGDEAALTDAATRLSVDSALRQRVGEANRAKAREHYDESRMIARYKALYWGVMNRRKAGPAG
ncbi:glycosyltransferase family 4 protein [Altericroceibacterium xinjiangense]|uniref:glycosyltransferase family 4 protein n=1 Tax=Altericroceibacterium xinjiangense TaxID=762261 RepID=UPI000F7D5E50|nr:glycosyltransferase family 4 protein [Altericroceibacterium xinjiangense]